jgi:Flp pilus assembly protein TadD
MTAAGCQQSPPPRASAPQASAVGPATTPIASRPASSPTTRPTESGRVETAPPATLAEDVEPSPNELVKDARAALAVGELDRALRLAKLAVVEAPGRSAAWNTLGRVQLRRGERAAALDSFEQAVECNPSSAWARNNHGLALLYEGRYEEAVAELEEATELQPDTGLMWNNLGMGYEHVDRLEEARMAYRRAMNLSHKGAIENFVRIEGVRTLGRTAKAEPTVDPIDEDVPMGEPRGL